MPQFHFKEQSGFYKGKVRDVYYIGTDRLVMVASNRISAFDVILPRPIPYKGQVLNQVAAYMLNATRDICPNWLQATPAPNVSVGRTCTPFKIEMVVRGNLTGHAWRTYNSGLRELCGVALPEGLKENDFFPQPIITPSTKAEEGHDEDISKEQIIATGLCSAQQWEELAAYSLALFNRGRQMADKQGLILVDTKYEFGLLDGKIYLMDEIHTPDSSRYFYKEGFEARQASGERQKQLSKEFVREWLIEHNFMGKEGQTVPEMTDAWVNQISKRYIELFEQVTGQKFLPQDWSEKQVLDAINKELGQQ
ncbi:phosphoribosylaminoimidazolesuccinocarboxamide synthase [Arachidicoccus ginsenosidivorans]|jgi:phosphoribosylaminoimidazole-succinocarboxamide synthase|uniref:Phosphoribosylaminoimidazole-succinocarboxamide synthase n=1 Tax=Arachidicoccus ginsenosidivorans TaxID=496057 RepID=A0A5B8VM94_9BACT|nr:phosphoribosylaminoimidazolesuccinocarboxamide synthase [Arachidicoccus ginsenosidivorans]QEC72095.1 phosphoribosylaminoimidazolesuccinocarboxamide synthase [Arachidicoccus ginsenosidivorans]